jgi:hypothetical protein
VPSPKLRLAIHVLPLRVSVKPVADGAARSDLLSRKNVSGVMNLSRDGGIRIWGPSGVSTITSGSDRTHNDTSASCTLCHPKTLSARRVHYKNVGDTNAFCARLTPILSTTSFVCLSPAVSATMTGKPPISNDNSRISLVVPGTGVTIAASRWAL